MDHYSRRTNNSGVLSPSDATQTVVFGHMHDPNNLGVLSGKSWVGNMAKSVEPMAVEVGQAKDAPINDRFRSIQTKAPVDREFGPSIRFSDYGVQGAPIYDEDRILRTLGDSSARLRIKKEPHQMRQIVPPTTEMGTLNPVIDSIPIIRDLLPNMAGLRPSYGLNGIAGFIPSIVGFSLIEAVSLLFHGNDYINTETDMEEDNPPETLKNLVIEGTKSVANFGFWNGFARSSECLK
jgi:hypothetical protein